MKAECQKMQIKIVTLGVQAASSDPVVKKHLASCPLCGEFLHSATDLETAESELIDGDVPEDAFARTISEVKKAQTAVMAEQRGLSTIGSWWKRIFSK